MFLLAVLGASKVFGHHQARTVVGAFELHVVHQRSNDLKSATASAFRRRGCNRGGRLSISPAERLTLVRHGDYKPIIANSEALMDFFVGAVAVLGGVDASLDQRGLDLIDCFLIEVGRASYLLRCARGD